MDSSTARFVAVLAVAVVLFFKKQIRKKFLFFSLNTFMRKFDLVFEKALASLHEREYIDSSFIDNVRLLVKVLKDNDYLDQSKNDENIIQEVMKQTDNVKELRLDTQDKSLPAMKLKLKQESDSESFSVTVIDLQDPTKQKEFANSMLETIFDDVISYIKTVTLEGAKPESAIDELPPAQGGNAQPGADQTALPQGEQPPTAQ